MKTYSVKDISKMLNTSTETVRRWIRGNKIKAIQTSRKSGNVVSAEDLERFISNNPRYSQLLDSSTMNKVAIIGAGVLIGGLITSALLTFLKKKKKKGNKTQLEDFTEFLRNSVSDNNKAILQKQSQIKVLQSEINQLSEKNSVFEYMLDHDDQLSESFETALSNIDD
ncbi:MAG: helix-turn-helix domain-containing protein [Clostridia bacterium]|nr:helix-turn-helix domain-containing protein [Clostridia bacterium]MBQ5957326.1 helix-turn-helix domain-containing protein [Clostridia bacterium]